MSKFLHGVSCYLSGPIEHDPNPENNWRTSVMKVLFEEFGIDVFDPFSDPKQQFLPQLTKAVNDRNAEEIARIAGDFVYKDLARVNRSDFIIAYLPKNVVTTGTHHEIIQNNREKKPTLLVADGDKFDLPKWYYGFIPINCMFDNWDKLYEYLREVDEGKHKDVRRWAYVYGLI